MKARGGSAVMASRIEAPDSLDDFPTPPFATRALCELVIPYVFGSSVPAPGELGRVWEPAANRGLMAEPLREYAAHVACSDVFDYGAGYRLRDFLDPQNDVEDHSFDWIVTNPPFKAAEAFARRAIGLARVGVALFVRLQWIESEARFRLFAELPPAVVAVFSERVALTRARWEPRASTATAYAWVVWAGEIAAKESPFVATRLLFIPPGQKQRLTRADDAARFATPVATPLLEAGP